MSINVNCPVCGRYVSVIGKNKIARHNNYASSQTCDGSGVDVTAIVADGKRRQVLDSTRDALRRAEDYLATVRADADKANAWAAKCLDDVVRLRVKVAAMDAPETDANPVTHVATLEAP